MNCQEFRRAAGADPQHLSSAAEAHARDCPACAQYLAEIVEMDVRLKRALAVAVPPVGPRAAVESRQRYFALAASVVFAVALGAASWLVLVPQSLAADVVEHMRGEPDSWASTTPATDATLEAAMQRGDAWFTTMPGRFVYVQSCWFRGHYVPHLVLETGQGPVTLLLLRHEKLQERKAFDEDGYRGVLLPVDAGAVAVVTHGAPLSEDLAARIAAAIQWTSK
jgi:anti-sigma factor RsiW